MINKKVYWIVFLIILGCGIALLYNGVKIAAIGSFSVSLLMLILCPWLCRKNNKKIKKQESEELGKKS